MLGKTISVAAVQMDASPAQISTRLARAEKLVNAAAQAGAQLVVLPEMFNTGYSYSLDHHRQAEDIYGPTASWIKACAIRNQVHLAGSFELLDGDEVYNSLFLFAPDGRYWRYDKNFPWGWERGFFREGQKINVAHSDLGDIGMLICWDIAHSELWRRYAGQVDLMIISTCPPDVSNPIFYLPDGKELTFDNMGFVTKALKNKGGQVFGKILSQQIAWLGVPAVVSSCCGRIRTRVPNGRLSLLSLALSSPRLLKYLPKANQLEMSSEIIPAGKIIDSGGVPLASLRIENGESFCITQVRLSKEKKQRLESQPKTKLGWLTYLFSDILLPWISTPVYRKELRHSWGNRMAPLQASTRKWSLILAIAGLVAFIAGIIVGKRTRK